MRHHRQEEEQSDGGDKGTDKEDGGVGGRGLGGAVGWEGVLRSVVFGCW